MRLLVIALTLISISSAYDQSCTPGSHFIFYCNSCVCSHEGRIVCTTNSCQPGNTIENRPNYPHQTAQGSQPSPITPSHQLAGKPSASHQVCTPNAFVYVDCNHCWCSVSGQTYTCTKLSCGTTQTQPKVLGHNQYPQPSGPKYTIPNTSHQQYPQQVLPNYPIQNNLNQQYPQQVLPNYPIQNNLNQQYPYQKVPNQPAPNNCNQQRPHLNIPNYPTVNKPSYQSRPSNSYPTFSGPNQNVQHQNPQTAFPTPNVFNQQHPTQKLPGSHDKHTPGCGHRHKRAASNTSEKSKKVCEAGKKFKEYCNDCICSADGTDYACTKKTCNSLIYNANGSFVEPYVCEPNTTFYQYCNLCVCPESGSEVVCSDEVCKDDTYEDGTLKNPKSDVYENGKTCTAGQLFYSGCNQCICREDGQSAHCTKTC